jgi:hypothetical protein
MKNTKHRVFKLFRWTFIRQGYYTHDEDVEALARVIDPIGWKKYDIAVLQWEVDNPYCWDDDSPKPSAMNESFGLEPSLRAAGRTLYNGYRKVQDAPWPA